MNRNPRHRHASARKNSPRSSPSRRNKSFLSDNLKRIGNVLSPDLLSAALGITEENLNRLLSGRDEHIEDRLSNHLGPRLRRIGLPLNWLSLPNIDIEPEHIRALRALALESENKAPLRRENFNKLVKLFENDTETLATALDLIPEMIHRIANGQLELNEQRDSHLNPRLMAAGFPKGWLEDSETGEVGEKERINLMQAAVDVLMDEGDLDSSELKQLVRKLADAKRVHNIDDLRKVIKDHNKQKAIEAKQIEETIESKKDIAMSKVTPTSRVPHSAVSRANQGAGRPIELKSLARKEEGEKTIRAVPKKDKATHTPKQRVSTTPQIAASAPAPILDLHPDFLDKVPTGEVITLAQEESKTRTKALNRIFDVARRGVKASLSRDILRISPGVWSAHENGTTEFYEELAREVEKVLHLPHEWLENPTKELPKLPLWVLDNFTDRPTSLAEALGDKDVMTPELSEALTLYHPSGPIPSRRKAAKVSKAVAAPEAMVVKEASLPAQEMASSPEPQSIPAPKVIESTPEIEPTPAPEPEATLPVKEPEVAKGFNWEPNDNPAPISEPGPLVGALTHVLADLSKAGTFTEQDALRLLNFLVK